jgi:hypothetical protein
MRGIDAPGRPVRSPSSKPPRITRLTIILAVAVFATSLYANLPHALGLERLYIYVPPFDGRDLSLVDHLGGEHRSIAEALAAGRGFADPFHDRTGPTAWMGPVLPVLQALLLVLGGNNLAVITIVFLQNITLVFTGWLVERAAARCDWPRAPVIGLTLYFAATWSYFSSCYQFTHDAWLTMLLLGVLIYSADRLWARSIGRRTAISWGLLGGIATLASPVLGPVWLAATVVLGRSSRQARPFLLSVLVSSAVMMPWIARNAIVFGRFIPVKSNLPFEMYQSNALEPSGVLRDETGYKHPFRSAGTERVRYAKLGEVAYLDEYRARFAQVIRSDPAAYLVRVKNRLLAATVVYYPFFDNEGPRQVLVRSLMHTLPIVGLVVVVMTRRWEWDHLALIALVIFVIYLTPYVLVAYYRRYAVPLVGLQAMFEIWALDSIRAFVIHRRRADDQQLSTTVADEIRHR